MNKIILTADFHIHPFPICSKDGGHDRLQDGLSVLRQSLDLARKERAVWVFAGDFKLPKRSWPTNALTGALSVMREFEDVDKIMIPGNHDERCDNGETGLSPFKSVARVVEKIDVAVTMAGELLLVPWNSDLEQVRKVQKKERRVMISHSFLLGSFIGPGDDFRLPGKGHRVDEYGVFPVAFFGDVHKGQMYLPGDPAFGRTPAWHPYQQAGIVRKPSSWCGEVFYPGSPYQQNWGERNDPPKGALIVDLEHGVVKLHEFKAPKFRLIDPVEGERVDLTGMEGDFVRVFWPESTKKAFEDSVDPALFRSFEVIGRKSKTSAAARAPQINAAMSSAELVDAYLEAHPPSPDLDKAKVREAGIRLLDAQ